MSTTKIDLPMRNQPFIGYHGGCGGLIRVADWGADYYPRWMRYEAWCAKCKACDPNGYGSRADTVAGAAEYFTAKPTAEEAAATVLYRYLARKGPAEKWLRHRASVLASA